MFLGLRTVIYPAPDLAASKAWFTQLLGFPPYFDEPFYVGFNVGGYELGLLPDADPADGPTSYWGVANAVSAVEVLVSLGATAVSPLTEVGDGIKTAVVREPGGGLLGVIENPNFELAAVESHGPGR